MFNWFRPKIKDVIINTHEGLDIYRTEKTQFTVKNLIEILNEAVQRNPNILDAPVYHIDFGGMTETTNVEVDKNSITIRHRIVNAIKPIRLPIRLNRGY